MLFEDFNEIISRTSPKKSLGQCFLINPRILSHISECCANTEEVIEIGSGTGNLTRYLLKQGLKVFGVEKDPAFEPILKQIKLEHNNFDYIISDALKLTYTRAKTYVGNLPYNIGSRILLECIRNQVSQMVFLLQREVVDRVCAAPNTSDYSALSVLCQAFYNCKAGLLVGPKNFRPVPKVDSRLLMCNRNQLNADFTKLSELLRTCFRFPRKQMRNNLGNVILTQLIDMQKRPSQITVPEYLQLLRELSSKD